MKYTRTHQAGDTIVEVIIAVAVISSILAGAFAVTNRSTQAVRDSEEHAQALQQLQGQVELLRAAAAISGKLPASLAVPFCLDSGLNHYAAGNASCANNPTVPYALSIVCNPSPSGCPAASGSTTTFDLKATWPSLSGGTDSTYLSYRVAVAP